MAKRSMSRVVGGRLVYASEFDQEAGTIMRMMPDPEDKGVLHALVVENEGEYTQYSRKSAAVAGSPSPETVDVAITQKCGFGCSFCYQDSTADQLEAPMELIESLLTAFDEPPYQIAYGGGSPTTHSEFSAILRLTREAGIVPNYTTEGLGVTKEVADATNLYCGGVSMTYHSWKGEDWFTKMFAKFNDKIHVQKNIHLIFDRDVVKNLDFLVDLQESMSTTLSVILLAYYPDVGRGTAELLPSHSTLHVDFPESCKRAVESGMKVAFSEGLLPYFLRRNLLDVSNAMASEGRYSCYISEYGAMRKSSFTKPDWYEAAGVAMTLAGEGDCYQNTFSERFIKSVEDGNYSSYSYCQSLGSIVKNPSQKFLDYAKACIKRSGNQDSWGKREISDRSKDAIKVFAGLDANLLWDYLRDDFTNDSGAERQPRGFLSMDCSYCPHEWRCSKEDTSPVHMLMCSTADFV